MVNKLVLTKINLVDQAYPEDMMEEKDLPEYHDIIDSTLDMSDMHRKVVSIGLQPAPIQSSHPKPFKYSNQDYDFSLSK